MKTMSAIDAKGSLINYSLKPFFYFLFAADSLEVKV